MTQTIDVGLQGSGSDPHGFFGALLDDSDSDFFVELDCLLECAVGDIAIEPKTEVPWSFGHSASRNSVEDAVGGGFTSVKRERADESLLRDDEILMTSSMAMFNTNNDVTRHPSPASECGSWSTNDAGKAGSTPRRKPVPTATAIPEFTQSKVPRNNQNSSRKRQRDEIENLRVSVDKLQIQLEALLGGSNTLGLRSETQIQTDLRKSLAWKRAASSEQQQAERGAAENLKLRALIQDNARMCKRLSDSWDKSRVSGVPARTSSTQPIGSAFTYVDMERPVMLPDSATFDSLRQGLDAQYQRLSTVWDESSFTNAKMEPKLPQNKLRSDDDGQLFFEHAKSHVFPFTTQAVSQTIWRLMKGGLLTPNNGELKICRVMGNTLYATINDTISLPYTPDSSIKVWMAMKRFIEDDQVVMVWRTKVEIQHAITVRLTECGWNVTRGLVDANRVAGSFTSAPCIAHTRIRSSPDPDFTISGDEMAVGSMTWKVVTQCHENMNMFSQKIENMLIDESMGSGGTVIIR